MTFLRLSDKLISLVMLFFAVVSLIAEGVPDPFTLALDIALVYGSLRLFSLSRKS